MVQALRHALPFTNPALQHEPFLIHHRKIEVVIDEKNFVKSVINYT